MSENVQRERGRLHWLAGLAAGVVAGAVLVSAVRLTAQQAKAPPAKPAPAKAKAEKEKAPQPPAPVTQEDLMKQMTVDQFAMMRDMLQVLETVHNRPGGPRPGDLTRLMGGALQAQQRQLEMMQRMPRPKRPAGFGPRGFGPRGFGPNPGLSAAGAQGDFHASVQDGAVSIDVTGTVQNGTVRVERIDVQDGGQSSQFNSVEQVPAAYRERVRGLIDRAGKRRGKIGPIAAPR